MSGRSRPPADLLRSSPEPPRPPRKARSRRAEIIAGVVLVAGGTIAGITLATDRDPAPGGGTPLPGLKAASGGEQTTPAGGLFPGDG
ncbi:hypothetical protein, partial [Actinocorallia lasiicapitis]